MALFRDLLRKNKKFYWESHLENLFIQSCGKVIKEVKRGVKAFELGQPTMLTTDFSKTILGFFLQ